MLPLRSRQDDNRHDLRIVGLLIMLALSRDDGWQERQAAPIQMSHRLCEKNDKHYSSKAREVKILRYAFMLTVNTRQAHAVAEDMTIAAFWEQRYLPYCKETLQLTGRPRKKPSTIRGYEQIWRQHLKSHFGNITLQEYEAHMGTQFLQSLTGTQGKATLKHI